MSLHAQSGICNLYQAGKRSLPMGAHVDNMERDFAFPVVSVSFGCAAVYLVGGVTKDEEPTPVLIRSGDIVVLSGESRLAYHGVARVVPGSSSQALFAEPEAAGEEAVVGAAVSQGACETSETSGPGGGAQTLDSAAAQGLRTAAAAAGADCCGQHAGEGATAIVANTIRAKAPGAEHSARPAAASGDASPTSPRAPPACACERACLRAFLQQTRINVNVRQVQPVPAVAGGGAQRL
jgi:hypothetical protein